MLYKHFILFHFFVMLSFVLTLYTPQPYFLEDARGLFYPQNSIKNNKRHNIYTKIPAKLDIFSIIYKNNSEITKNNMIA